MSTSNHVSTENARRYGQKKKADETVASVDLNALELAQQARSRAEHEVLFLKNEIERLYISINRLQERCEDYAMRLAMSHGEREELVYLRSKLFDTPPELDIPKTHLDIVPNNVTDQLRLLVAERDDARMWLDAVRHSTSWRITRPFRVVIRLLKSRLRT